MIEAVVIEYLRDRIEAGVAEGNQRKRNVATLCTVARPVVGPHSAGVFTEALITDVMIDFDSPMASIPAQKLFRVCRFGIDRGHRVDDLGGCGFGSVDLLTFPGDTHDLFDALEIQVLWIVHGQHLNAPALDASMALFETRAMATNPGPFQFIDRMRSSCEDVLSLTATR